MFREGPACKLFQGELWVAGGSGKVIVEIFNFKVNTWRTGPSMVKIRVWFPMEKINNTLVVFGGGGGGESTMEKLVEGVWKVEPMKHAHARHTAVVLPCPSN